MPKLLIRLSIIDPLYWNTPHCTQDSFHELLLSYSKLFRKELAH